MPDLYDKVIIVGPDGEEATVVAGALSTSGGGGGGGGGPATIADGADVAEGAVADPIATAGGVGTVSAKLRKVTGQLAGGLPAALGAGGGIKIDGSGTVLPVSAASLPLPSGAATSALQGGGLPAALGAGGGLKVDGSGTALPVSAASLPLPSGAATSAKQDSQTTLLAGGLRAALAAGGGLKVEGVAGGVAVPVSSTTLATVAKQPALGTAGTASSDVITVQGIASATPVIIGGSVASGAADSGNPVKIGGKYNSTLPTFADGQRGDLQIGAKGQLLIGPIGGSSGDGVTGNIAFASPTGSAAPVIVSLYSGAGTYDRARNNLESTLLASAARTATTSSADQVNYNGRGVLIVVNVADEFALLAELRESTPTAPEEDFAESAVYYDDTGKKLTDKQAQDEFVAAKPIEEGEPS